MLNAKNTSQLGRMLLLAAVLSTGCATHALAADSSAPQQNADVVKAISDLDARMERLENRLIALERTVSESQNTDRGNMLADHEARLQALEDQTSKIYGKADEVGNAVSVLAKKVEAMGKDMNMRLTDLEQKVANAPAAGQAAPTSATTGNGQKPADATKAASPKNDKGAAATPASHPAVNVPAKVAADKLYQQAYDYMKKAAFPQAEAYFAAFVDRFPDNAKAENAYYWLGEVYLVEKRPDDALIAFRNGIRAFPSGSRTPDSLLKMGVAFQGIDKPDLAKATWQKLAHDFPDSHAADSAKKYLADAK